MLVKLVICRFFSESDIMKPSCILFYHTIFALENNITPALRFVH